ncbi:MAG TPA: hypothetical protein VN580_05825, partial [Clostridia bacterium]|nr:hypothetical protein [Clostridia bacterium]
MDNANNIIAELLSLIDQKSRLFGTIMEMTVEQKRDIEESSADNIEMYVKKKQEVIDSIDNIDRSFSEKFDLLKKALDIDSLEKADFAKYPALKELKLKVEEIMALARDIIVIEEANKEKLGFLMSGLMKEMKQLKVGKRSIKAYETPVIN